MTEQLLKSRLLNLLSISILLSPYSWSQEEVLNTASISAASEQTVINERFSLDEIKLFARIFQQIRQNYVEEVTDAELFEMAIVGMLNQLDPHSTFLNEEDREYVENQSEGTFHGVGLELTMRDGEVTVIAPYDDSPASRAGIQVGDVVLEINGQSTWGMSLSQALEKMAGELGTDLHLMIGRNSSAKPIEMTMTREKLSFESVRTRTLAHDIGYLRVRQFQTGTGQEFKTKLSELMKKNPHLIGLILDLRNNPGGIMRSAIEISDAFLSEGLIVSTRGRTEFSEASFYAGENSLAENLPLVVLINQGSASASEIVAGALQDHQRAVVMGDISFGKGSVQNVVPIDKTRGVKLTTARYFTPSGKSIQAQGIYPDVMVLDGTIRNEDQFNDLSEANLLGHLSNIETIDPADNSEPELVGVREVLTDIRDIQLSQAASFLKGLAIYNQQ